jgi:hypothetical protein
VFHGLFLLRSFMPERVSYETIRCFTDYRHPTLRTKLTLGVIFSDESECMVREQVLQEHKHLVLRDFRCWHHFDVLMMMQAIRPRRHFFCWRSTLYQSEPSTTLSFGWGYDSIPQCSASLDTDIAGLLSQRFF